MKWGKSSDASFHSGFVSADRSPRFVLRLCVDVRAKDVVVFNAQLYHGEDVLFIYLYVAPLTHSAAARALV